MAINLKDVASRILSGFTKDEKPRKGLTAHKLGLEKLLLWEKAIIKNLGCDFETQAVELDDKGCGKYLSRLTYESHTYFVTKPEADKAFKRIEKALANAKKAYKADYGKHHEVVTADGKVKGKKVLNNMDLTEAQLAKLSLR